ncbi:MAG TPA: hypothetical protein VGL75_06385 [Acidothermaceae bacterium]
MGLLEEPIFQGVVAVVATIFIRKLVSSPPPWSRYRWGDAAVGPDLLLLSCIVTAGKLARLQQLDRVKGLAQATHTAVDTYTSYTLILLLVGGMTLLLTVCTIPVAGWVHPTPHRRTAPRPAPYLHDAAVFVPLFAGVVVLFAAVFVIHGSPQ